MARAGLEGRSPSPDIGDYAFISDCESAALVSRAGSVEWCCLPRVNHGSCFGRLLDWGKGGHCSIAPTKKGESSRRYLEDTLVLETTFRSGGGEARVLDSLTVEPGSGPPSPRAAAGRRGRARPARARGRLDLRATLMVRAAERFRLAVRFAAPHLVHADSEAPVDVEGLDATLEQTIGWWREWAAKRRRSSRSPTPSGASGIDLQGVRSLSPFAPG